MALLKKIKEINCDTGVISALADRPEMSAPALKAKFDAGASSVKESVNYTISQINDNIDVVNNMIVQTSGMSENKVMSQKAVALAISDAVYDSGGADMHKSVYDSDGDGVVDNAAKLGGMTWEALKRALIDDLYPVGSIKITVSNVNPATKIGGRWEAWGAGRVPVGIDTADTAFSSPEKTGGEKSHALTEAETGEHTHSMKIEGMRVSKATPYMTSGGSFWNMAVGNTGTYDLEIEKAGGGAAHNNLQPYIVCYMWKRTA